MTKVFQRFVDGEKGDCMQAAISSLFDIPYEDTPKFIEYTDGFALPLNQLAMKMGYAWGGILHNVSPYNPEYSKYHISSLKNHKGVNGFFYASVYSPKYFKEDDIEKGTAVTHAVIIDRDYNIVHDPNPGNAGIKEYPMADKIGYNGILYVLILNPAKNGE